MLFTPSPYCLLVKTSSPHNVDRARLEGQVFSTVDCLAAGQEELILLQEKVKNGKLSVDEALEKFKHWQMGKTELEMIQQVIMTLILSGTFTSLAEPVCKCIVFVRNTDTVHLTLTSHTYTKKMLSNYQLNVCNYLDFMYTNHC